VAVRCLLPRLQPCKGVTMYTMEDADLEGVDAWYICDPDGDWLVDMTFSKEEATILLYHLNRE
jgi:hypothetical protein